MRKNLLLNFSLALLFILGTATNAQAQTKEKTPTNLAVQYGSIHSDSGSEGAEPSSNLIDGITHTTDLSQKWCKATKQTHWVIIDLGETRDIASFKIFDCKVNEPGESNFDTYNIYVGDDVSNLTKVVEQSGREGDNIKEDILATNVQGRYVKLEIPNFGTIRIWQFEIYDSAPSIAMDPISTKKIINGIPISVTANYTLRGPLATDFACEVNSEGDLATVSNVVVDAATSTVTFDLTAPNIFGVDNISVQVTNDGEVLKTLFKVKAISDDLSGYVNVALNKNSTIWSFPNWENVAAPAIVDGDDDSFFSLNKSLIEPIVDLTDKYVITTLQYIYKCTAIEDRSRISGVSVYTSPSVAAGTDDEAYVLQEDRFAGAEIGELKSDFVVLDAPTISGSLKFKFNTAAWIKKTLEIYELKAFSEKPTIVQPEDLKVVAGILKPVEVDFDLKGFAFVDKSKISFSATSSNAAITVANIVGDFDTNKLSFDISSATAKETGVITVTITSPDFTETKTFNVEVTGTVSIEENENNGLEVWPTVVNGGEIINVKAEGARSVRLVSLLGTVVSEQRMQDDIVGVPTSVVQAGTYLLQVVSDRSFETVKVIIK